LIVEAAENKMSSTAERLKERDIECPPVILRRNVREEE
jgi:hypothetical protein